MGIDVKRILILGGESSGKTTLVSVCSEYFGSTPVFEFGRLYGEENDQIYTKESLHTIARTQRFIEECTVNAINGYGVDTYVFCDTNELVTSFYAQEWYNDTTIDIPDLRIYHKIYVLKNDFPFVQDGSRQNIEFSQKQYKYYVNYLCSIGLEYIDLSGSINIRLNKIMETI